MRSSETGSPAAFGRAGCGGWFAQACAAWLVGVVWVAPVAAQAPAPVASEEPTLEQVFTDYLHFARMGMFDEAGAFGKALLARPDCKPDAMLNLSERYRNSIATLQLLVDGTSLADSAAKILEIIHAGAVEKRKNPEQITQSIALLAGDPTQRMVGMDRLKEAGEYAVPWLVDYLGDPAKRESYPYAERALPQLGRPAINPLVESLRTDKDALRQTLIDALGEMSYPQAMPYLRRIADDAKASDAVRKTATEAIARILGRNPDVRDLPAPQAFVRLATLYYYNTPSLRADPREELANVWFYKGEKLAYTPVPRAIFNEVQCMRCCEQALALQPDLDDAVALWLAANFRREAILGMDVRSVASDDKALADATRPKDYPRSVYFAMILGPRYSHMTLARGIHDRDVPVALGAVTALSGTASASELVGPEDVKQALTLALKFPDALVRINAALALARSLPKADFTGSRTVVPILASALDLRGRMNVLIADPGDESRLLLEGLARKQNAAVASAATFTEAINRARKEMTQVDLVILASDIEKPDVLEALAKIQKDDLLELAPVLLAVKPDGRAVAEAVASTDDRVVRLPIPKAAGLTDAELETMGQVFAEATERAQRTYRRRPIGEDEAVHLAAEAADALRLIAVSGTKLFDFGIAEEALIRTCSHPDEDMRLTAASALAWAGTSSAQSAIAKLALDKGGSKEQRIAALGILSESAKRFGRLLTDDLVAELTSQALREPDLEIRTAAGQALGALSLGGGEAAEIIHMHPTS